MPGAVAPAAAPSAPAAPKPQQFSFSSNAPGSGAQVGGTNFAMQNLNKALQASNNTTQFQQGQLQQQLQNNQANIAQNLTNRGLGNTTIADTMAQAPLQTYNMGMAQLGDLNAMRQMQAYGNLANAAMQGGNAITATDQPYAQTNYAQGIQAQQQQMANLQNAVAHQNAMGMQPIGPQQQNQSALQGQQGGQNQAQQVMQQPLYFTPGQYGMGQPGADLNQLALAAQGYATGVGSEE